MIYLFLPINFTNFLISETFIFLYYYYYFKWRCIFIFFLKKGFIIFLFGIMFNRFLFIYLNIKLHNSIKMETEYDFTYPKANIFRLIEKCLYMENFYQSQD